MHALSEEVRRLEPHRICIIKPSSLGDIAHSLPILPILRGLFPLSHITWVVNHAFRELLACHPDVDRVISFERGGSGVTRRGVASTVWLCRRLLDERYDLTIDLQGLLRSGLMTAATRARVKVGMADAREGAGWFYTHAVAASRKELHAVDRILRIAAELGDDDARPSFTVPVGADDVRWAEAALAALPRPRLVLNPGARWRTKRWPPGHFAELARRAVAEFGAGIVVVGSSADAPLARELQRHLRPAGLMNLTGRTTLLQLAALARLADLFVSNDTGPLHLAAAAGAGVVGIYTCTDPDLTGPYGPRASTVRSCVWCAPSFRKSCRRLDCLAELSPDRVWPSVRQRLAQALEKGPATATAHDRSPSPPPPHLFTLAVPGVNIGNLEN
jgi:lipopolysaccharide heptosyltransferase I